jgi:uncharacterized membrane protein YkoI
MKMKLRSRLLLAATCLATLAVVTPLALSAKEEAKKEEKKIVSSIRPAGKVKDADLPGLAKISFDAAMKAALAAAPGSVIKAELEVEDGNLMYSFEIVGKDKSVTEVEIDAGNGKVLDVDKESADEDDDKADAKKEKKD